MKCQLFIGCAERVQKDLNEWLKQGGRTIHQRDLSTTSCTVNGDQVITTVTIAVWYGPPR